MKIEHKILADLKNLYTQYEDELDFLKGRNMDSFDTTLLPEVLQDMIRIANAKTPSFSNISALAVANFILSHTFGQVRPKLNDGVYSDDAIGLNTYSIIIARSGGGKDSTYQALMKTMNAANELITTQQANEAAEKARGKYIRDMRKSNPNFDEATVVPDDYIHTIPKPETPIASLASTRGGLSTSMNRMAYSSLGAKAIFASELGLAIQSNSAVVEVLELFSILFDMGQSVSPEYKTQESKEESINGMFPNLLGISSSAPFYQEGNVRKLLVPMLTTSLARRTTVVFSTAKEEFENEVIPKSPMEKRRIQDQARVTLQTLTSRLDAHFHTCIKSTMANPSVMFDDDAARLYDDYKSYTQEKSKYLLLDDGESVEGIEMSGRAFKMGRIAAVWSLAQGKQIIDESTLKSAIYFCDYTASHLIRFAETLSLKDYELFINDWEQGFFDNVLPVDKAITRGYISTSQLNEQSLRNFLKPVNSRLEGVATVQYNDKSNAFVFTPVTKNLEATYTYRAVPGIVEDKPLANIATGKQLEALSKLPTIECTFNPFADTTTKFVVIPLKESFLPVAHLSKYLEQVHHFATDDLLILPLNSVVTTEQYKYVCMSIAAQLMVKVQPTHCEASALYYGTAGATLIKSNAPSPKLFDISGILGHFASGVDLPLLYAKPESKPSPSTVAKYMRDDILPHKQALVEAVDAASLPLLLFASVVHDMAMHSVDFERINEFVHAVNSALIDSFSEELLTEYILNPFKDL